MFAVTQIDLLIADPILSAYVRIAAKNLSPDYIGSSNYWVFVEDVGEEKFISACNGFLITSRLNCPNQTYTKLKKLVCN